MVSLASAPAPCIMPAMRTLTIFLLAFALTITAVAAEPWLKPNDVVALVGGEDMVALAEESWLETLVTWAQPKDRIRFRSLAWEGDTVFEQRRDLNYPTLEAQLDQIGATVVICQFGKMESFAGKEGVAAFTEAYEKLIARLSPEGKRRIALVLPTRFGLPPKAMLPNLPDFSLRNAALAPYAEAIRVLAAKKRWLCLDSIFRFNGSAANYVTRDGIHLIPPEHRLLAFALAEGLGSTSIHSIDEPSVVLKSAIAAKNRMWFHYSRPQNWAFLAGNRTNQPSSRDHRDPTKRWFPEEMEQWLPLIEAKEKEIWTLAAAPR